MKRSKGRVQNWLTRAEVEAFEALMKGHGVAFLPKVPEPGESTEAEFKRWMRLVDGLTSLGNRGWATLEVIRPECGERWTMTAEGKVVSDRFFGGTKPEVTK